MATKLEKFDENQFPKERCEVIEEELSSSEQVEKYPQLQLFGRHQHESMQEEYFGGISACQHAQQCQQPPLTRKNQCGTELLRSNLIIKGSSLSRKLLGYC